MKKEQNNYKIITVKSHQRGGKHIREYTKRVKIEDNNNPVITKIKNKLDVIELLNLSITSQHLKIIDCFLRNDDLYVKIICAKCKTESILAAKELLDLKPCKICQKRETKVKNHIATKKLEIEELKNNENEVNFILGNN